MGGMNVKMMGEELQELSEKGIIWPAVVKVEGVSGEGESA